MHEHPEFGDWIVQERLRNHPDLAPLNGEGLHTLRVVTVTRADGTPEHIWSGFRIAVGDAVIDNYRAGALGNLTCETDLASGSVTQAFRGRPHEPGMERIDIHPTAGIPLAGLRIPLWDEAVQLALDAAPVFLPLRTLGFDIGLTPDGPKVVEMNMWWDVPYNVDAREIVATLWSETGASSSVPSASDAVSTSVFGQEVVRG